MVQALRDNSGLVHEDKPEESSSTPTHAQCICSSLSEAIVSSVLSTRLVLSQISLTCAMRENGAKRAFEVRKSFLSLIGKKKREHDDVKEV